MTKLTKPSSLPPSNPYHADSEQPDNTASIDPLKVGSMLSEERYRRVFETAQDGILLLTIPEGVIFDVNPYFLNLIKYRSDDIVGKKLWELGLVSDSQANKSMHDELLTKGYVRYDHLDLLSKDGQKVPVEIVSNVYQIHDRPVAQCNVRDISQRRQVEQDLQLERDKRRVMLLDLVETLAALVASRDPYTATHQKRVASLACAIAGDIGVESRRIEGLQIAALLHDIGKISVPVEILTKPGRLTHLEVEMLQSHAKVGYELLKRIEFPWPVATIVLQHHERMDGSGYPNQLLGEQILLEARILAVADMVDAMSSQRPYRLPKTLEDTLHELETQSAQQYDPQVVASCLGLFRSGFYSFPSPSFDS